MLGVLGGQDGTALVVPSLVSGQLHGRGPAPCDRSTPEERCLTACPACWVRKAKPGTPRRATQAAGARERIAGCYFKPER